MKGLLFVMSDNFVIGNNTTLPLEYSPAVIGFIRECTKGKVVVQGSTTFIYHGPIKDNDTINVVISSMKDKLPEGYDDIIEGKPIEVMKVLHDKYPSKDVVFMGGMSIYEQFLAYCNDFYIARVHTDVQGNVALNKSILQIISSTSNKIKESHAPEIPTYPKTTFMHYRRSVH